jgi:hypothetical protein
MFEVTSVQNVHRQQQGTVDNDVKHTGRLLMEQRRVQFQFHASGLAVYAVLRTNSILQSTPQKKVG